MQLRDYLRVLRPDVREAFARDAGTSVGYLYLLGGGHRKAGHALAKEIEKASAGVVTRYDLRPDIFGEPPGPKAGAGRSTEKNARPGIEPTQEAA